MGGQWRYDCDYFMHRRVAANAPVDGRRIRHNVRRRMGRMGTSPQAAATASALRTAGAGHTNFT
eukprot:4173815-Alexandrium_andersonii.AAC.1